MDVTSYEQLTEFEELRVKTVSNMYHPQDHETLVGIHGKEWIITKDSAILYQRIQWLFSEDTEMTASYMTMFPAIRGNDNISSKQITSKFYDDIDFEARDCATYGFNGTMSSQTRKVTIYSSESGFYGSIEVLEYPLYPNSAYVYMLNRENTANKIYFGICGYGLTRGTVKPNQIWKSKFIYKISITK